MTYSELKTAIESWTHRNDLTADVDLFIDLFEARASRSLRATEMEATETVTPLSEVHALPTGWIGFKNVQYNGAGYSVPLEFATSQKMATAGLTSGTPIYYTINGGQVEFSPDATGAEIEWTYYEAVPPLSDTNTSNWLLAKYPDYYLMGCIQQAALFAIDPRADQLEAMLQSHEHQINKAAKTSMSGPMVVVAG